MQVEAGAWRSTLLNRNTATNFRQLLRNGLSLGCVSLVRGFCCGLLGLLAVQLLCESFDLQLLRGQSILQRLDIRSRDGRWCRCSRRIVRLIGG